jgi:hypothetical protein
MRAMRQTLFLVSLLLAAACGNDHGLGNMSDMSMPPPPPPGPDMAVRLPDGVACGVTTCSPGMACCLMTANNQVTGASCIPGTGQCSGATISCDGPEDCTAAGASCCATLNTMTPDVDGGTPVVSGGGAMCSATCAASIGTNSVTSRLCHLDADCANFSVTTPLGPFPLDKCCSSAMAPGVHFCANALLAQFGVTCN